MTMTMTEDLDRLGVPEEWFDETSCDGCECDLNPDEGCYVFTCSESHPCICKSCYDRFDQLFTRIDSYLRKCDVCFQYIRDGSQTCKHFGESCWGFDMCSKCESRDDIDIRKMLVYVNRDVKDVVYTERDIIYRYGRRDDLVIPDSISDRIVDFDLDDVESLVRPPSYDADIAKWQFIDEFEEVPHYPASCCWAVRCEPGHHEVASVVCDDHGRIAMNIAFPDVESFLNAESKWRAGLPDAVAREALDEQVVQSFTQRHSCDEDLMASATDNFAVYYRLTHRLVMYYG